VAGARSVKELLYLTAFFDRNLTNIVQICAPDEMRLRRYSKRLEKAVTLSKFLENDDRRILLDLHQELLGVIPSGNIKTIVNDTVSLMQFQGMIKDILSE
jgi:hypothetical protein